MRRPPAIDLQWVVRPAVTTMTRPDSGSASPPPPPHLNRPIVTFGPRPAPEIESELRSFRENSFGVGRVATAAVKSVCYVSWSALSSTVASHWAARPSHPTAHRSAIIALVRVLNRTPRHVTPCHATPQTTHHVHTHTNKLTARSFSRSLPLITSCYQKVTLPLWLHVHHTLNIVYKIK